jgi:uncharacterized protein RhaS with RHS repeats
MQAPGVRAEVGGDGGTVNIFRWYRAGWGRYTQADPIGLDGDLALYSYTRDNPLSRTDRLGLKCCVKNIYGNLRPQRHASPAGFTNRITAEVCADVENPQDCVVTQKILSGARRESGPWRTVNRRRSGSMAD